MTTGRKAWKLEVGYRGKRFYIWNDRWDIRIYENLYMRNRRFEVQVMSCTVSNHQRLREAKIEVLKRLFLTCSKGDKRPSPRSSTPQSEILRQ